VVVEPELWCNVQVLTQDPTPTNPSSHRGAVPPTPTGGLPPEPGSGRGRSHGTSSSEPFDRWFRYAAGFASDYVSMLLQHLALASGSLVVDPFAGSAVTGTAARKAGYTFYGVEAHPLIAELGMLKLQHPPGEPADLVVAVHRIAKTVRIQAEATKALLEAETSLTRRCFTPVVLAQLVTARNLILSGHAGSWQPYAKWALLGALRDVASVRVGWPYQRPGTKRQPRFTDPMERFCQRASWMAEDLRGSNRIATKQFAEVWHGDARAQESWSVVARNSAHGCVSSPPYLNNFDYADSTRLELYFWGEVATWSQMCSTVRAEMITATTQQSSIKASQDATEQLQIYKDVAKSVAQITSALRVERLVRKRGKEYDRVVPAYFWAISQVLTNLAAVMTLGAPAVWLIGDSAPYGVYIDTPSLISRLAEQIGFVTKRMSHFADGDSAGRETVLDTMWICPRGYFYSERSEFARTVSHPPFPTKNPVSVHSILNYS
jgi:uncharacterized membrane protein